MELEIENTEVVSANNIQIEAPGSVEVIEGEKDYKVSVVKKEYTIIGDSIFIPSMYEDAPPWLKEFIDTTLEVAITNRDQSLIDRMEAILTLMDYVPKNMYTEQINQIVSEDGIINSRIATLNSNLTDAISSTNATVAEINLTYASKDEASAIATNVLTASLSGNGEIGSALKELQEAYADLESTTAQSISMLESVMEGEINGNATAMETIRTYVGIDSSGGVIGTGLLTDVKILQKQNDGIIETVTGTYDVMVNPENPDLAKLILTAEPYATWKAADVAGMDTRLSHIGDVYIKYSITDNGAREYIASYKFIRTVVDTTSPFSTDNHGFTWALIVDQAAQDAYNQALNAYDLADNKRRVFTSQPVGDIDEGDLWVAGSNPQVTKVYKNGAWETADTQVAAFVSNTYTPAVASLQSQVDSKIESWYTVSTIDPKTAWTTAELKSHHNGDMWYQTDTKKSYWYSSSTHSWNLIDDEKAIKALANAATAQSTADGKITSHYINTFSSLQALSNGWTSLEKTNNIGDLATVWNDGTVDNNGLWRWSGTSWVSARDKKLVALASSVTNLSTELGAGTNTWASADSALESSLKTEISDEVVRVESKFAYNSVVNINGTYKKTGFGLTTNYTSGNGTQANPYVSEFWIDASRLKFTNSNQTGRTAPFTIDATGPTPQVTFNGKVAFGNVNGANMSGSNLLYNSAPAIGFETKGWQADYNSTGIASSGLIASGDPYRPTGGGAFHQSIPGTPAAGTVFDIRAIGAIPVIGGQFYEGSAYLNSHRCNSQIYVGWRDSAGTTITWSMGDIVTQTNTANVLSTWGRSKFIVQAPANAVSCYYYIRGTSTGETNPYVFVSMCYFGRASEGQSVFSSWSEGISASLSSSDVSVIANSAVNNISWQSEVQAAINNNATYIDGGKIVTNTALVNNLNAVGGIVADTIKVTSTLVDAINVQGGIVASSIQASAFTLLTEAGKSTTTSRTNSADCLLANNSLSISTEFYDYAHASTSTYKFAKPVIGNLTVYSGTFQTGSGIQNALSNKSRILFCAITANCTLSIYLRIGTSTIASGSIYVAINGGTGTAVVGGITFYLYTSGKNLYVYCSSNNYCTASTNGYSGAFNILLSGFGMPTYSATIPILVSHHNI